MKEVALFHIIALSVTFGIVPCVIGVADGMTKRDYNGLTDLNKDCGSTKRVHYVVPTLILGCKFGKYLGEEVK